MKTINVPLVISECPAWDDEIPAVRLAEFGLTVSRVHQELLASANRSLLKEDDPRQWHRLLFESFVPVDYYAGFYRGVDGYRPCLAVDVCVGPLKGSDHRTVRQDLAFWSERIRRQLVQLELDWATLEPADRATRLAIIIANLVGDFIRIHPFINGNGRTSRLLWRWGLLRFGVPPLVCTSPRPNPPYSELMQRAMAGDYRPLVLYVLQHLKSHAPIRN